MSLEISGVENLSVSLRNVAQRASEGARLAMKRGAENVANLAKDYAPIDVMNLENAIKVDMVKEHSRARASFEVYIDEAAPAVNPERPSTSGKKVGEYAFEMHEGTYNLGKFSLLKQAQIGKTVGRKFLERAVNDLKDEITEDVQRNVNVRVGK